jgi:hypothetical protein
MKFITQKRLPRRTFLRGAGASVALPFLDAMVPAGRNWAKISAEIDKTRLICIEIVHGSAGCTEWGETQNLWSPAKEGRDFDLSPSVLKPLEPFQDYLTIVSNTDMRNADAFSAPEIGGDHFRSSAVFLTQMHPKQTEGSDVLVGMSLDQIFANRFGQDTPIPSMQFCIENVDQAGGCSYGYACVYTDTISWSSATEPLPMIRDPRVAFDMLFGAGGTPKARAERRKANSSILDWVAGEVGKITRSLGPEDRVRLESYLENVRELERRIQKIETQNSSGEMRELPEAPAGVPDSFSEHVKLMFDLQALAFQNDMTRVFSLKLSRDALNRVYPESGIDLPFHPTSHHGNKEEVILEFAGLNEFHVSLLPHLLEKLKGTQEGDYNLLDKTAVLFGSPMGDPNVHNHRRIPLLFAGHANGKLEGNLHLKAPDDTPTANVMLSLLHSLGHEDMESFGDSTGAFPLSMSSTSADMNNSGSRG